jgi:hypothetical protein
MSHPEVLRRWFAAIEVNGDYSEAVLTLRDHSRLEFRHKVGERWVKAVGASSSNSQANRVLPHIAKFRLNAKHLDITFSEGDRWEICFGHGRTGTVPSR